MLCKLQHCKHKRSLVMSFTEQDMKKQMEDFAALREEFSRLESQEKPCASSSACRNRERRIRLL